MQRNNGLAENAYRAIGRFICEFSQLEYTLRHHLGQEIELAEKYFDAVLSYDFALLCTVVKDVFSKSRGQEFAVALSELIKKCHALNDARKRVAHGLWVAHLDGGAVHYVSRTKLKSSMQVDQATELQKLADDACNLRAQFERLFMACSN